MNQAPEKITASSTSLLTLGVEHFLKLLDIDDQDDRFTSHGPSPTGQRSTKQWCQMRSILFLVFQAPSSQYWMWITIIYPHESMQRRSSSPAKISISHGCHHSSTFRYRRSNSVNLLVSFAVARSSSLTKSLNSSHPSKYRWCPAFFTT